MSSSGPYNGWSVRLRSTGVGEAVFRMGRALVHAQRRRREPELDPHEQMTTVHCCGQPVRFRHRRTYADRQVLEQCFDDEQYRTPNGAHGELLEHVYREAVNSGRVPLIIDCGANIGASVVWFAHRFPQAHVVAVEPAPDNFELLRHNTAGLNVDLRQAGIAVADGLAYLEDPHEGAWAYRTSSRAPGEDTEAGSVSAPAVAMLGLNRLLAEKFAEGYLPLLLKIDIEGAESGLFTGDTAAVASFPCILLEPHDWMLPGQRSSLGFFRWHVEAGREFCMKGENVASVAWDERLLGYKGKLAQ